MIKNVFLYTLQRFLTKLLHKIASARDCESVWKMVHIHAVKKHGYIANIYKKDSAISHCSDGWTDVA